MSTVELDKAKLDLIAWINELSDEHVIGFLVDLKTSEAKGDWWDGLSSDQHHSIKKGMSDIAGGHILSSTAFWNALKNG